MQSNEKNQPVERLEAFDSYAAFLAYVKDRFDLHPGEPEVLYKVLVKLQNVGADPLKTMEDCRFKMARNDCLDMLRFMMYVENMDLDEIKADV